MQASNELYKLVPSDVWFQVISYLDAPSFGRFTQVCKQFKEMCDNYISFILVKPELCMPWIEKIDGKFLREVNDSFRNFQELYQAIAANSSHFIPVSFSLPKKLKNAEKQFLGSKKINQKQTVKKTRQVLTLFTAGSLVSGVGFLLSGEIKNNSGYSYIGIAFILLSVILIAACAILSGRGYENAAKTLDQETVADFEENDPILFDAFSNPLTLYAQCKTKFFKTEEQHFKQYQKMNQEIKTILKSCYKNKLNYGEAVQKLLSLYHSFAERKNEEVSDTAKESTSVLQV